MNTEDLVVLHPRLFHMAERGSWPAIEKFGLLTTKQIVQSSKLSDDVTEALLNRRRPKSTVIDHPQLGAVVIRDQAPLRLQFLEPKLTDMTVQQWINTLNSHVFFWPTEEKLEGLLNARNYRHDEHDVLTVDAISLIASCLENIRLSPINSGSALYPNAAWRGSSTFAPIAEYDYVYQKRRRGKDNALVELAIAGGVPDIRDHVVQVRRMRGSEVIDTLYSRE